ncbi:MAG: carbohydrate-binding domain-containing protein, partial [Anaerolineae bacterium]|nr:carbohydrate-binding domain-containing protein [Anaerolineae bacterium]
MVIFQPGNNSGDDSVAAAADEPSAPATAVAIAVTYDAEDLEIASDPGDAVMITLSGDTVTVSGDGVGVEGSAVTITSAGAYHLSGTLDDGQIIVDTEDVGVVTLILNGVDVACTTGAPLYVANAEKAVVTLAAGSVNTLIDGASYVFADPETEEPNAALFSNDDLTINGEGALTVQANYNNGIASDDALKITGGVLTVVAVHDGIQGKDYVAIKAGSITVMAGNDGVQATSTEDAEQEPALSESQEPALSES